MPAGRVRARLPGLACSAGNADAVAAQFPGERRIAAGTAEQIATATSLVPVQIEISHREAVLSLPVLLP